MEAYTLDIEVRSELKKAKCNGLRREGRVPAVVYHRGEASVPASLERRQLELVGRKAKASQVFTLRSKDIGLNGRPVIVRQLQRNFQTGQILHVDFQALKEDEEITVKVPLTVIGEAPGVKNEGGVLTVPTHEVGVSCLPKNIPETITVEISTLGLGQSIHAKDLVLPSGVRLIDDAEETLVSVVAVRGSGATEAAEASGEAPPQAAADKGGKKGK